MCVVGLGVSHGWCVVCSCVWFVRYQCDMCEVMCVVWGNGDVLHWFVILCLI